MANGKTDVQHKWIKGATLEWVKIKVPNDYLGKKSYTADVSLTDEQLEALKGLGTYGLSKKSLDAIKTKLDKKEAAGNPDRRKFMTFSKNYTYKDKITGEVKVAPPPSVVDKYGDPYDGLIGNGTIADVRIAISDYAEKRGEDGHPAGTSFKLAGIVIRELVEYVEKPKNAFGEDYEFEKKEEVQTGSSSNDDEDFL